MFTGKALRILQSLTLPVRNLQRGLMYCKTIMYKDLDGNPLVGDFYFNLSKSELVKMEVSQKEGMEAYLKRIVAAEDNKTILAVFESIILTAYGRRSEDNVRFMKSPEISMEFNQTDAYDELMFELMTHPDAAAEFIRGIMPADMDQKLSELALTKEIENQNLPSDSERKVEDYSQAELLSMNQSEFDKVAGTDPQKMSREVMLIAFKRRTRTDPVT